MKVGDPKDTTGRTAKVEETNDTPAAIDSLLLPLLNNTTQAEWHTLLGDLIAEHAAPIIKKILRYRFSGYTAAAGYSNVDDSEDLYGEIVLKVVARLLKFRENPNENAIASFRDYVAVTTYNACHEHFRQRNPDRASLKNRLRYLVTHHPAFYRLEKTEGRSLYGLASRSNYEPGEPRPGEPRPGDEPHLQDVVSQGGQEPKLANPRMPLPGLVQAILSWASRPMDIDELTNAVSRIVGTTSQHMPVTRRADDEDSLDVLPDLKQDLEAELENRLQLRTIWNEICHLPLKQ